VFASILLLPGGPPLSCEFKALLRLQRPVVSPVGVKNISAFFMFFKKIMVSRISFTELVLLFIYRAEFWR